MRRLVLAATVFGGCLLSTVARGQTSEQPNILFVFADDVGQEVLGAYGGTTYHTPHIDALAETGMRFEHCYSQPVCHPTRVVLMTGRYPSHVGNPGWGSFPEEAEGSTIAQVMKDAGYSTAIAGKWQLTLLKNNPDHPQELGFDASCLFGWHEGPRYFDPLIWQNGEKRKLDGRYGPNVYREFLVDFMKKPKNRPFFAVLSMALCHAVADDFEKPVPRGPRERYQTYKEMVREMDRQVGLIVDALERLGVRKRTLVLFTADNGTTKHIFIDAADGKLVRAVVRSRKGDKVVPPGKGEMTDGGTRVPLIANWPGTVPEGAVVDTLVDFTDFLPTFAELGGGEPPADVGYDGKSFAWRLLGEEGESRPWVHVGFRGERWVRTRRWKLYQDGRLFDMRKDPREKSPILPEERSAAARAAQKKLQKAMETVVGK